MMEFIKRHWAKLLIAAVLVVGAGGFYVYRTMFHVDPEFEAKQEQLQEEREAFDEAAGIEDETSFDDLESELEEDKP